MAERFGQIHKDLGPIVVTVQGWAGQEFPEGCAVQNRHVDGGVFLSVRKHPRGGSARVKLTKKEGDLEFTSVDYVKPGHEKEFWSLGATVMHLE